ncbi:MAG: hypothetical protein M3235_22440 [Actinomycetota bacterium]|nr:hypothetical protein [Actinomycetota bacterium]
MRASVNVALQIGALVAFAILRLLSPGWLLLILIVTVVGLLVLLVPPVLSLVTLRREVLPTALTLPFLACAGLLLLAGLTLPDFGDADSNLALWTLIAGSESPVPDAFGVVGMLATLGYLASVLWLIVALATTGAGTRRPVPAHGPPYGWVPAAPAEPARNPVTPDPQDPPGPGSAG